MSRTRFAVTLPDGRESTRSSERTYTHVVIAEVDRSGDWTWGALQWSQSETNATKGAAQFGRKTCYRNVRVVPIEQGV